MTDMTQFPIAKRVRLDGAKDDKTGIPCMDDTDRGREVAVQCIAPYEEHKWKNIGKAKDGMAPDSVQYAQALKPPYHLLSFLHVF